jgi:hypothetical protein
MLVVIGLLSGGCSRVSHEDKSAKLKEAMQSRFVSFDLRTPPSREEGGLFEGKDTAFFDDHEPFDAEVQLPEDHVLRLRVDSIYVNAPIVIGGPSTEPPDGLKIKIRSGASEARTLLLALAAEYGLAKDRIEEWGRYTTPDSVPGAAVTSDTGYLPAKVGYIAMSVQAKYRPEGDGVVTTIDLYWREYLDSASPRPGSP